ncbi:hypothetical protein D1007_02608 [Hordeum vulgare]|nr:hypothetical protein D1007_02608 [Hordeum vulgare]
MAPAEASSGDPSPAPRGVNGVPASRLQGSESDVEIQKISPRALTAWGGVDRGSAGGEYGVDRCSAGGEYGQFCGGSLKADPHRRWDVLFRDSATNSQEDRPGYMFLHLQSMWATIRDEEGDILVGRYLQKDEFPKAGQILLIDGYRLEVLEQSGTQNKAPVSVLSRPSRFGGRFWVLADQEEETDEELGEDDVLGEVSQCIPTTVEPLSPCTPSPSMAMLQERKVRRDPILVRKKMEASSRKPWSGPIPKGQFLNAAIKAVGHEVMASSVGFPMPKTGYKAQDLLRAQPQSDLDCRSLGYMAQEKPVRFDGSSPEVASGVGLALHPLSTGASPQKPRVSPNRGFPRLGAARAVRVPPPSVAASLAMAGRGSKQPANGRPLGQVSGQGNPPVAKSSTPAQAGSSHTAAHAGKSTSGASGQAKESTQANRSHRGRWGDEGGNGYDDGHFRGGSSSGGGRGFHWQNNGFNAPPDTDKDTPMADGDDASGSKDNAEGSKDTGNGPNSLIAALHQGLRFGSFEPASAPAKFGSRSGCNKSAAQLTMPRFLGKHPRCIKESMQSRSMLQPLSLGEFLAGARAANVSAAVSSEVQPDSDISFGGASAAGLDPREITDSVVQISCLKGGAGEARMMCMQAAAVTQDDSGYARAEPTSSDTASMPVSAVAVDACGGAPDFAADAQLGCISRAVQPDEARVQQGASTAATMLATQETATVGGGRGALLSAPVEVEAANVGARASEGVLPHDNLEVVAGMDDPAGLVMAGTESPTAVAPESGLISVDDVIAFGEEPNVSSSDEEEVGLTQEINLQIAGVLRHDPPLYVPEMIATLTQERESKQRDEVEQGHVPENAFIQQQSQSQQPVVQSTATKGGDVRIKREVVAIARLRATTERREIADQAKFDAAIAKLKEEEGKIKLATEKKKEELLARKQAAENKKKVAESIDGFVPDCDPAWEGLTANDEDRVEVLRRVVHRRTSTNAVRPWKGPLPKVRLPALTLADFFHSCKQAPVRKPRRPAATSRPTAHDSTKTDLGIREAKESRLNLILCQHGPESKPVDLRTPGYMAQSVAQIHQIPESPGRTLTEIDVVTDVVKEGPLSGDSPRHYNDRGVRSGISGGSKEIPGFPSRSGTARSIPALATMAARQGVPSAPAASASAGTAPAVTAPAAAGPAAGVAAPAVAGAREINQAKVPTGQGRGSAGAGRVLTPPRLESSRTGLVKVTNGDLTAEQVSQQMRRLVSEAYNWEPIRVEQNTYQVEFPRREDLQRLLTFGVSKVSGSKCLLEFEECIKPAPQGTRLQKVWIRFAGIPEILLNDFLIVWSLGSLIGKTEKVDMPFTRKRGIARLLVMVLDVDQIPDFAPWSYDGVHYDLEVEVEKMPQNEPNDDDILMADGEDRDKDHEDANDQHSNQSRDNTNPHASSNK